MKDIRGTEIELGDTIVTSKGSHSRGGAYQGIEISTVISFSKIQVKGGELNFKPKHRWETNGRFHKPENVIVIAKANKPMSSDMSQGV
jgi:hypothetical protein